MDDNLPSNLPSAEQAELFPMESLPNGHDILPEYQYRFTAEQVAKNEKKYKQIVRALANGLGIRQTAAAFSVSAHTVMAIRQREPELLATEKKDASRKLGAIVRMSLERYEEALIGGEVSPATIPLAVGIFLDKKEKLDGEASIRVEHIIRAPRPDEIARMISDLPEAIEVESSVNSAIDHINQGQIEHTSDCRSDVNTPIPE